MTEPATNPPTAATSNAASAPQTARRKPRLSLAIATAFGLGYVPKAPGTFGSLAGLLLATMPHWIMPLLASWNGGLGISTVSIGPRPRVAVDPFVFLQCWLTLGVALVGLWSAHRASKYWDVKDPQRVVIDEVSGQQLALLLGGFWPLNASLSGSPWSRPPVSQQSVLWGSHPVGLGMLTGPNWKYLLLGFILFRVFDIWKPFPARQAESLPGGLGIMADDWIAGVYAALGLWMARALGL